MRAIARGRAKELLSVAGRTLLDHALDDLERSGIAEALIVTSPGKPEIEATLGSRRGGVELRYEVQPAPLGLADALALAESFAGGEPFVCWLPDNLWSGSQPATAQLLKALAQVPDVQLVGLIELDPSAEGSYGSAGYVDVEPGTADLVRIERVHDKGSRPQATGARRLKGFPLDVWQPELFERIKAARKTSGNGELDDTPFLQAFAREGRLFGVVLRGGRLFDCGFPGGLESARAALGD